MSKTNHKYKFILIKSEKNGQQHYLNTRLKKMNEIKLN